MIRRDQVTLGILAGGQASRLGRVDKALVEYRGRSLIQRTLSALGDGFAQRLLSHPTGNDLFIALGIEAVPDKRMGFFGPLAGIEALLEQSTSDWLLTVPVDLREIPGQLCERLLAGNIGQGAALRDADGLQPLVCLWPVAKALPAVKAALDRGEGAVHPLQAALGLAILDISPWRLGNLNRPSDFE